MEIHVPTHKAAEITLRFSEQTQAAAQWSYKGKRYPKEMWRQVMDTIGKAGSKAVTSTLKVQGGRIQLELRTQNAKDAFEEWQSQVSAMLENHEKEARKKNRGRLQWNE
jgi:phosphoribosylformimino-5-aminoimidazole carboxamide ribonucleotide (ProFAR) isomerase